MANNPSINEISNGHKIGFGCTEQFQIVMRFRLAPPKDYLRASDHADTFVTTQMKNMDKPEEKKVHFFGRIIRQF